MQYINRTPKEFQCGLRGCPAIYEPIERTPKELQCIIGACPSTYEDESKEVYLIIGKQINPKDAGLEEKVGEGEVLIEVPKGLIDGMKR